MLKGGCHCGGVRYEVRGAPREPSLCHCADCRRASGAPAVAWFTVDEPQFVVVAGPLAAYASSPAAMRGFCPGCGTPVTFRHTGRPGELDVTTCSLDDPGLIPPERHTFAASRVPWMALDPRWPADPQSGV